MTAPRAQTEGSRANELWADLLARVSQGDQGAVAEFYDASSRYVFGLVLRILGDRPSAEEVTLDVYVQVWKQAGNYSPERGSASSWLLTMSRSRAIDRLRSKGRRQSSHESPMEALDMAADDAPTPEQSSVASERRVAVQTALGALQSPQREAIELAYFSGFSHSEIADRLGEPLGTVKTRIRLGMLAEIPLLGDHPEVVHRVAPSQGKGQM